MDLAFWDSVERIITDKFIPHLTRNRFYIDLDGKVRFSKKVSIENPWVFIRGRDFGDCYMYKDVWFDIFNIIPSFCQNICWKVVIKPTTVKELFELYETLRRFNVPSKCGIESRPYSKGHYAGFIYNNGEAEGQARYKLVREATPEHIPVFLKRGCTEYELAVPSDKWEVTPIQSAIEMKLMQIFQPESLPPYQPQWVINAIKRSWIFHAYKICDNTYKEIIPEQDWEFFPKSLEYQK